MPQTSTVCTFAAKSSTERTKLPATFNRLRGVSGGLSWESIKGTIARFRASGCSVRARLSSEYSSGYCARLAGALVQTS